MKQRTFAALLVLIMLPLIVLPILDADNLSVYGRIRIPSAGICAEVYTTKHGQDCGCTPILWNGGKVTVDADLSAVEIGDMADLRGLDGEHYVLECIDIRQGLVLLMEPQGDVLVVNGRWVYRFTRL